jgi:hypothetical protein
MSAATDDARRLAEDAFAYTPLSPASEREEREQYVLFHGRNPHHLYGLALRLRAGADVETIADEVRAWFAERGRTEFTWLVSDSSTPQDLRQRLLGLGAQPDADEPVYSGMVLTKPPPAVEGIEARPVETFEEYAAVRELGWTSSASARRSGTSRGPSCARPGMTTRPSTASASLPSSTTGWSRPEASSSLRMARTSPEAARIPTTGAEAATAPSCAPAGMRRRRGTRRCSPSKRVRCRSRSWNVSASSRLRLCTRLSTVRDLRLTRPDAVDERLGRRRIEPVAC